MIDGNWGVGKTYQINKFIKNHPNSKNFKFIYISLFGKNSKEEIHTELYSKLHPRINLLNKTAGMLSTAISLIPEAPDISKALDFVLDIAKDKSVESNIDKVKKQVQRVLIFDDLERKGENLDFGILLGYFNQLMLNNFKIAVICSEKEINKDKSNLKNFSNFKEKIFDRYYSITMADEDVIKNYFQEDNSLLDNEIINLFNDNLRLASKTSKFYFEAKNNLEKEKKEFSKGTLLWYCSLIVVEFNSAIYLEEVNQDNLYPFEFRNLSEEVKLKLKSIHKYDEKIKHPFKATSNSEIIEGIYQAYLCNDYEKLYSALTPKNSPSIPILLQDEFYLDVNGKKKLLADKFKYIYESKDVIFDKNLLITINSMFEYKKYFPKDYNEDSFAEFLAKKYVDTSNELFASSQILSTTYSQDFFNLVIEKNKVLGRNEMLKKLKDAFIKEDCFMVEKVIQKIYYGNFTKNEKNEFYIEIQDFIKENNFFLPNLAGNITQTIWRLAREACDLATNLKLTSDLKVFLEKKLSLTNDEDEQSRLRFLLAYYFK